MNSSTVASGARSFVALRRHQSSAMRPASRRSLVAKAMQQPVCPISLRQRNLSSCMPCLVAACARGEESDRMLSFADSPACPSTLDCALLLQSPEQLKQMQEAYQQAMSDPEVGHILMEGNAVGDRCGKNPCHEFVFSRNAILNELSKSSSCSSLDSFSVCSNGSRWSKCRKR